MNLVSLHVSAIGIRLAYALVASRAVNKPSAVSLASTIASMNAFPVRSDHDNIHQV